MIKTELEYFEKLCFKRNNSYNTYKEDGILEVIIEHIIDTYRDSAHFVYELIQNADDANATKIKIRVEEDYVLFKHNGKVPFTVTNPDTEREDENPGHVNAITTFKLTTKKKEDIENKIGKFGIGFKSVFQYTNEPEIYNINASFVIKNYMCPEIIKSPRYAIYDKDVTTIFYLPFNSNFKTKEEAYKEIIEKVTNLDNPLLFLNNINTIEWSYEGRKGCFNKSIKELSSSKIYPDISIEKVSLDDIEFLKFSQKLRKNLYLSVCYPITNNQIRINEKLKEVTRYAHCYFPTKDETRLNFIIHAPFILTPNREGIKEKVENAQIIEKLAYLSANSLDIIKDLNLIDEEFFKILPVNTNDFDNNQKFRQIYDKVKEKLQNSEIIPTKDGRLISRYQSYLFRGENLINLLDPKQISDLLENEFSGCVFPSITENTEPIYSYVKNNLIVKEVNAQVFVNLLNKNFIEGQSIDFLIKLYEYLLTVPYTYHTLKTKPILKLSNDQVVPPFEYNIPKAYLPMDYDSEFPIIKKELVNEKTINLFKQLGITEPSLKDEVLYKVIPRFEKGKTETDIPLTISSIINDTKKIFDFSKQANISTRNELIQKLRSLKFLLSRNDKNVYILENPNKLYYPNDTLKQFFSTLKVNYIELEIYEKNEFHFNEDLKQFLIEIGVSEIPRIISTDYDNRYGSSWTLNRQYGYTRYYEYVIEDYNIEGLSEFLSDINLIKSKLLVNLLHANLYYYSKTNKQAQLVSTSFSYNQKKHSFESHFINKLRFSPWLFNKYGELFHVNQVDLNLINEEYDFNQVEELINYFNIPVKQHNESYEFIDDDETKLKNLLNKAIEAGVSIEDFESFINSKTEKNIEEKVDKINELEEEESNVKKQSVAKDTKIESKGNKDDEAKIELQDVDIIGEFSVPSIDIEKKINKIQEKADNEIKVCERLTEIYTELGTSSTYSYKWFCLLLELEFEESKELTRRNNPIKINFYEANIDTSSDDILLLYSKDYIPNQIEDNGDLSLTLNFKDETRSLLVEVVSPQKKILKAKVKNKQHLEELDLKNLEYATVELKNSDFILENLFSSFKRLKNESEDLINDGYNFLENLNQNIKIIFGPPGTGKTTYLAEKEIIPLTKEGGKILILTPTNKSADVMSEKIIDLLISKDDYNYIDWLVRFGITKSPRVETEIFNSSRIIEKKHLRKLVLITTIARFPYDFFKIKDTDYSFDLRNFDWDYIIFDEASMITLPSIIYAIFKVYIKNPNCKFIIGGDPFQISPIYKVNYENWKDSNIFTFLQLNEPTSFLSPIQIKSNVEIAPLKKQYRSIPQIGSLFSELSYQGKLEHHRTLESRKKIDLKNIELESITMVKFPISKYDSLYKARAINGSPFQIYSAFLVVEFIKFLSNNLKLIENSEQHHSFSLGVICPYRIQNEIIDKLISKIDINPLLKISVGTIHSFQGDECDMMINVFNPPKFISDSNDIFLNKQNIINVAISRARDYLVLFVPYNKESSENSIDKLFILEKLKYLIKNRPEFNYSEFDNLKIEELCFGKTGVLDDLVFPTSHQNVNIYGNASSKYEVRFDNNSIDIQLSI